MLNSEEVHSILSMSNNIFLILQFPPDIFNKIGSSKRSYLFNIEYKSYTQEKKINQIIDLLLDMVIYLREKKVGYELRVEGAYYQLVSHLLESGFYSIAQNSPKISYETEIDLLNQLNDYIKKNFAQQITVNDVCKALAISSASLYSFLKETIGMTVGDLIRYHRIREAKKLLLQTQFTIYQIAHLCGYKNEMTFYRGFKKEIGVTPNQFRMEGESENNSGFIQGYLSYNSNEAYKFVIKTKEFIQS